MICSSGIGFDPTVEGERLRFGFHGIWQGVAVLYDRKTESQWLHLSGECIRGELKGKQLQAVTGYHTTWKDWREQHPETKVMAPVASYVKHYFDRNSAHRGAQYFPDQFQATIRDRDGRLALTDLLYGVVAEDAAKAYPLVALAKAEIAVVNDQVGNLPIVVVFDRTTGSCGAFVRELDGKPVRMVPDGDRRMKVEAGDDVFDFAGVCVAGGRMGQRLQAIGLQAEWYGWYATYPKTTIWRPTERAETHMNDGDDSVETP